MHILFLTDNFIPEVNAPASRTYDHCLEWTKQGHKVTVVTCAPNFPYGKVYEGYKNNIWSKEIISGITVVRVWSYIAPNSGKYKRIVDYLSYMVSSLFFSLFIKKVDIVIGTSPQFFTVCSSYLVSKLKNIPWVFELRDIWPESVGTVEIMSRNIFIKILEKIEIFLYKKADLIIPVTYSFREYLLSKGISQNKIKVITNGINMEMFTPQKKDSNLIRKYCLEDKIVIGYIGTLGLAHGLEVIIDTATEIEKKIDDNKYMFIFLGDGANKLQLQRIAKNRGLKNVIFIDTVEKKNVVKYWSILDATIIHLRRKDLFKKVIPSKIFESIGMSIPILLGVDGEASEIVNNNKIGISFEPENHKLLRESILQMFSDESKFNQYKENCRRISKIYDRKKLSMQMLEYILKLKID